MPEVKDLTPPSRRGEAFSNPVGYLTRNGWVATGDTSDPNSCGWWDPTKPDVASEELVDIEAVQLVEEGTDERGKSKWSYKRLPLQVRDHGKLGDFAMQDKRVRGQQLRYTPACEPCSFQFALQLQRERDLAAANAERQTKAKKG